MSKKSIFLRVLVVNVVTLVLVVTSAHAQEPVTITWFCCLGTGGNEEQLAAENQVVADFNASQDAIELVFNVVPYESGRDTLATLIASGQSPDIVGPVGVGGSNAFNEQWLDLQPLIDSSGYDLSSYDPALVEFYHTDAGQVGLPFASFPVVTYDNRGLFDEAGLNYPPQEFGAPYVMPDGTEVEWNYDTVAEIAQILTVDANGNDATMDGFDPDNIVQFGMNFQWAELRLMWTDVQPEVWYDAETNEIVFPDSWRAATQWIWDALWTYHFMPNTIYDGSALLGTGNAFNSGTIAMAVTPLWYTCCLDNSVGNFEFDFGVVPMSPDGEYHVAIDMDTFRMTKGSAHPDEAFTALSYLLGEAVPTLAPVYGAFPARAEYQQAWVDGADTRYPFGVNWQVAIDSLAYANPISVHHESNVPNWQKARDRTQAFSGLLFGDTGADMDIEAELDTMIADLNAILAE